ncbi:MAG: hypothetical protein V4633_02010 [Pseudomonadota bacterium]
MFFAHSKRAVGALLLLAISLWSLSAFAEEQDFKPNMYFENNLGRWTDLGAAESALRANFAQTTYAAYFDVTGLVPIGTSSLNGQHVAYSLSYTANSLHPEPRPSGASQYSSIQRKAECALGMTKVDSTPSGYEGTTVCKRTPPCCKSFGNPITVSGVKIQEEIDYAGAGLLMFKRIYRSDRMGWIHNYQFAGVNTGALTEAQYDQEFTECIVGVGVVTGLQKCYMRTTIYRRVPGASTNEFFVSRPGGHTTVFKGVDYLPPVDVQDRLKRILDANGQVTEWQVYNAQDDRTEVFNTTGKLTSIRMRNGQTLTLTYSDVNTPVLIAPMPGLLIKVSDSTGGELNFIYNESGLMKALIDPAGERIEYAYEEASAMAPGGPWTGHLTSVTYQDGKRRVYWYSEPDKVAGTVQPFLLTGISDEEGNRYATYEYDEQARGISTEHAGGVEKYRFTYSTSGFTTITDPLNITRISNFSNVVGANRSSGETMIVNGITIGRTTEYDSNGNVNKSRDYAGTLTTYEYDLMRNLETKRTEGSYSRTISTEWHPTERLVARVAEPKRITTFTHFPSGLVNTKTVQATTDEDGASGFAATKTGTPRTWTYAYNGSGRILTITGPRTDVLDLTTFEYDTKNNLISVTNAVGHKTTLSDYDAHGRARRITDPNNVITNISYSPRGWMMQQEVKNGTLVQKTIYDRDGMGQLKRVTFPDGSYISYTYDAAHRLTDITDSVGNNVHYTLDNKGNRLEELTRDPGGALTRKITRVYNALSRLEQVTGGTQ